jgi:hypothetical protein
MKSLPLDWVEKAGDAGTKAFFGFLKVSLIVLISLSTSLLNEET